MSRWVLSLGRSRCINRPSSAVGNPNTAPWTCPHMRAAKCKLTGSLGNCNRNAGQLLQLLGTAVLAENTARRPLAAAKMSASLYGMYAIWLPTSLSYSSQERRDIQIVASCKRLDLNTVNPCPYRLVRLDGIESGGDNRHLDLVSH